MNKQERIIAYRLVDSMFDRGFTAGQVNKHIGPGTYSLEAKAEIINRAQEILDSLRQDAKDLWDES